MLDNTKDKETILDTMQQQNASSDVSNERVQLIVFKLAGEEYALPIEQIKEVVLTPDVAQIPHTPSYIKGVANIRGNVIAILDLEEKFNLVSDVSELKSAHYTLVIESEEHKGGILVRDVPNTLTVKKSELDNTESVMQYSSLDEDCINGIVKIDQRLVILLDIMKMLENENVRNI